MYSFTYGTFRAGAFQQQPRAVFLGVPCSRLEVMSTARLTNAFLKFLAQSQAHLFTDAYLNLSLYVKLYKPFCTNSNKCIHQNGSMFAPALSGNKSPPCLSVVLAVTSK
jgi:hypothetical protein